MLTRENFKDTWARPKPEDKKVGRKGGENEMSIDMPPKKRETKPSEGVPDAEMADVEEKSMNVSPMEVEKAGVRKVKLKSWPSKNMPIFPFQRYGIGAVKRKFPQQKHGPLK